MGYRATNTFGGVMCRTKTSYFFFSEILLKSESELL